MMTERERRDFEAGLSEEVNAWLRGDTSRRSFLTRLMLMGGAAMLIVAVLSGYSHWGFLLLFLVIWRLVQDYIISPRVMGSSVELHPLAALFGILAGGEIAGVLGVYLSIPVMASLRIVWRRWRIFVEKRRFGPLNDSFPHVDDSFPHELGKG